MSSPVPALGSPDSLRLLCIYDCLYPSSVGGVEHRNFELARALAARGHRVTLAAPAPPDASPPPGVDLQRLGQPARLYGDGGRRRTAAAVRFAAAVARCPLDRYDVVETANIPYAHLFALAARCRRRRLPLLVTWYEYWGSYWCRYLGTGRALPYRIVERLAVRVGTRAVASSALVGARVAAARSDVVPIVPIGIPFAAIVAASRLAPAAHDPQAPLVYAGRLVREKRLDILLHAVARLAPGRSAPLLTIVGDGPDHARLEALAAALGLARHVVFTGWLPQATDVWRLFGSARLAVQPSEREGYGLFPLEAMAAGLPVVYCTSSESAVSELVRPEVEGAVAEPTAEALARALGALLDDPAAQARLAAAARRRGASFAWDSVAQQMEEQLLEIRRSGSNHDI